ncbi:MAG: acyl transferase, partial [Bacteroidia bacterium]|nr:acyl transferase [Bacteroidia bacterium]
MEFNPYEIFNINGEKEFNQWALRVFEYQYQNNVVYKEFVNYLHTKDTAYINNIKHYTEIPFLPIELFKTQKITCFPVNDNTAYFESSGTTQ